VFELKLIEGKKFIRQMHALINYRYVTRQQINLVSDLKIR